MIPHLRLSGKSSAGRAYEDEKRRYKTGRHSMAQIVAKIDTRGEDTVAITFASPTKEGTTTNEKLLVSRIVKALATDPTMPTPALRNESAASVTTAKTGNRAAR